MSKISFRIGEKEVFTVGKSDQPNVFVYILSLIPGISMVLLVLLGGLSYYLPNDFSFSNILLVLGLTSIISSSLKFLLTEGSFKKLKLTDLILVLLLISLVISRIFSGSSITNLLNVDNRDFISILNTVNHTNLVLLVSMVLLFRKNYYEVFSKLLLLVLGGLLLGKLGLDTWNLLNQVVFEKINIEKVNVSFSDLFTYLASLPYIYMLLKGKYRRLVKGVVYVMFVCAMFLVSTSLKSTYGSWMVISVLTLLGVSLLVFFHKQVMDYLKSTLDILKKGKYVTALLNILVILLTLSIFTVPTYLLYTSNRLDVSYVTSIFTYFWEIFSKNFTLASLFSGTTLTNVSEVWSHVGMNYGWVSLLLLAALIKLPFVYLYRSGMKNKEVHLYMLVLMVVFNLVSPVSILPILLSMVMFLVLSGSSKDDTLKLGKIGE